MESHNVFVFPCVSRSTGDDQKDLTAKLMSEKNITNIIKSITYISKKYDLNEVIFAGGVSASKYISNKLKKDLSKHNIKAYFTDAEYSTDNGVGCALIGLKNFDLGE